MEVIKRILLAAIGVFLLVPTSQAQFIKNKKKESKINWQNQSVDENGVYGIGINKAYELLKNKKPSKEVIVAIIGPGIDTEHEDLQTTIWQNKKETANGVDDDKNGYVDDINGWNYLGNPNGDILEEALSFGDREFLRLKDLYSHLQSDGKNFFTPNDEETEMLRVDAPKDRNEFNYYNKLRTVSALASKNGGVEISRMVRTYLDDFDKELRTKYPDKKDFTAEDFASIANADADTLRMVSLVFANMPFGLIRNPSWNNLVNYLRTTHKESTLKSWEKTLVGMPLNDRKIVGDNPNDIQDTKYGNNILLTENAGAGTMYAGIVAARPGNGIGIDGITSNSRIMVLRTNPNKGDAFMKDIARAIRYAVDNGADIIQLSSSAVHITPYGDHRRWIEDALSYAESKDVLIIQPVLDLSYDMDREGFFPSRKLSSGKVLENIITVAASDQEGNPLLTSNFGIKSLDIFAPGKDIYSTYTGDTYRSETGSDMAGSVTTGVVALLKSYFPKLSAKKIREIIISSVTDRSDNEVEKQAYFAYGDGKRLSKDLFLFEDLCASAGILNAEKAVKLAGENAK